MVPVPGWPPPAEISTVRHRFPPPEEMVEEDAADVGLDEDNGPVEANASTPALSMAHSREGEEGVPLGRHPAVILCQENGRRPVQGNRPAVVAHTLPSSKHLPERRGGEGGGIGKAGEKGRETSPRPCPPASAGACTPRPGWRRDPGFPSREPPAMLPVESPDGTAERGPFPFSDVQVPARGVSFRRLPSSGIAVER